MGKPKTFIAKKIWPTERKLINKIITKEKGYHNKPYPDKNKIPTEALHSVSGALHLLDIAEKKKANKGYIRKYRKTYEHKNSLPEAHYMAFKKNEKPASSAPKKPRAPRKPKAPNPDEQYTRATLKRLATSKEENSLRLQKQLEKARRQFVPPEALEGSNSLRDVLQTFVVGTEKRAPLAKTSAKDVNKNLMNFFRRR